MNKGITLRGRVQLTLIIFSCLALILWFGCRQINYDSVGFILASLMFIGTLFIMIVITCILQGRVEKYYDGLVDEQKKTFDTEMARQKMHIGLLSSQMDSHFITNTVIAVKSLADRGENEQAAQVADGLGYLLKHQRKGGALINIFDEFMALQKYIEIMSIRYGGRFAYDYEIDDLLSEYSMPGFILQPIVENALEHGLGSKELDARLYIKGFTQDGKIYIKISDNGVGIPPGKLKTMRDNLANTEPQDFPEPGLHGVALINVHKRIRLQFGLDYGVDIESDFGKGTMVTLIFPLIV